MIFGHHGSRGCNTNQNRNKQRFGLYTLNLKKDFLFWNFFLKLGLYRIWFGQICPAYPTIYLSEILHYIFKPLIHVWYIHTIGDSCSSDHMVVWILSRLCSQCLFPLKSVILITTSRQIYISSFLVYEYNCCSFIYNCLTPVKYTIFFNNKIMFTLRFVSCS